MSQSRGCCCLDRYLPLMGSTTIKIRKSDGVIIKHFDGQWRTETIDNGDGNIGFLNSSFQRTIEYNGVIYEFSSQTTGFTRQRLTAWNATTYEMLWQTTLADAESTTPTSTFANIFSNGTYLWVIGHNGSSVGRAFVLNQTTGAILAEEPLSLNFRTDSFYPRDEVQQIIGPGTSENTCQFGPYVEFDESLNITQSFPTTISGSDVTYSHAYLSGETYCLGLFDGSDHFIYTVVRSDLSNPTEIGFAPIGAGNHLTGFDGSQHVHRTGESLDVVTNNTNWTKAGRFFEVAQDSDHFYSVDDSSNKLEKVKKSDGSILWSTVATDFPVQRQSHALDETNGVIYSCSLLHGEDYIAIDITDGSEVWRTPLGIAVGGNATVASPTGDYIYVTRTRDQIFV